MYKGSPVDLSKNQLKGRSYNIYGLDDRKNRYVWKGVNIDCRKTDRHMYYVLTASAYNRDGKISDRRVYSRIPVGMIGNIQIPEIKKIFAADIYDISNSGIAFVSDANLDIIGSVVEVEFEDEIRGHTFTVSVNGKVTRKTEKGDQLLYGCKLLTEDKIVANYVYIKKMDYLRALR